MNEECRVVNRIELKPIAKVWVKFLKFRLMPTTHTTTVSQDRLMLLYTIIKGLTADVGKVIEQEIKKRATKKQKYVALLFPLLIKDICEIFRVKFMVSDERINNEGALIARTIERAAGEPTATATSKHPVIIKLWQVTEIGKMLQELSERLNACIQAQKKKENKRFWTYLLHLKA